MYKTRVYRDDPPMDQERPIKVKTCVMCGSPKVYRHPRVKSTVFCGDCGACKFDRPTPTTVPKVPKVYRAAPLEQEFREARNRTVVVDHEKRNFDILIANHRMGLLSMVIDSESNYRIIFEHSVQLMLDQMLNTYKSHPTFAKHLTDNIARVQKNKARNALVGKECSDRYEIALRCDKAFVQCLHVYKQIIRKFMKKLEQAIAKQDEKRYLQEKKAQQAREAKGEEFNHMMTDRRIEWGVYYEYIDVETCRGIHCMLGDLMGSREIKDIITKTQQSEFDSILKEQQKATEDAYHRNPRLWR